MKPESEIQFEAGVTFQSRLPGRCGVYRIVEVSPRTKLIYAYKFAEAGSVPDSGNGEAKALVRIRPSASEPLRFTHSELESAGHTNYVHVPVSPHRALRSREELNDAQKAKFDKIKSRIERTWASITSGWVLDLGTYWKTIEAEATNQGIDRTTLARDMGRFFGCGLDADAAAMNSIFARAKPECGRSAERATRKVSKKLGRPNKMVSTGHDPSAEGTNVSDAQKEALKRFLNGVKDRQAQTYASLHRKYREEFAVRVVQVQEDGFVMKASDPKLDMTEGQCRYWIKEIEDAVTRAIKKASRKNFDLRKRILVGHARDLIGFPGHTYVIDSTVLDIYCVSVVDRRLLIGRPVLYLVIDAFSQAIVSVHVALEGPNMRQARVALYLAVSSKEEHLDALGVRGDRLGCIQGVKPLFVFSDRGELLSQDGRELSEAANLAQSIAAPYRADWKSLVERSFGVLNQLVIHWTPGGVRQRARERGDRDRKFDAVLTVNELKRILWSFAFEWNLTKDMTQHVSCSMLRHEIDACPTAFWRHGLEHLHGSPILMSEQDAMLKYLPAIPTDAKRDGLHPLQDLRFTANWMRQEVSYFELVENKKEPLVYLNPNRPLSAFMLDAQDRELRALQLVDQRGYANQDVCLEDVLMMEKLLPLVQTDGSKPRQNIKDSQAGERSSIIAEATAKTNLARSTDSRSRTQKGAEIKANRKDDLLSVVGLAAGEFNAADPSHPRSDELDAFYERMLDEEENRDPS